MDTYHELAKAIQTVILNTPVHQLTLPAISSRVGYSQRHCMRAFKAVTGKTIPEYIRLLRLTSAARTLLQGGTILDVALSQGYDSHEGFTKAFRAAFGVPPSEYRRGGRPIPYFIPYPVALPQSQNTGENTMENNTNAIVCTATFTQKPERMLAFLPAKTATDYFSYCEEVGCEWEGLVDSIPEKLDLPVLVTLPADMTPEGYSSIAGGIELPPGYNGELPPGFQLLELPACTLLDICTQPYSEDEDYCQHIDAAAAAYATYQPIRFGYRFATGKLPFFNYGAPVSIGARIAAPVEKL